jgi:CreA protein
MIAVAALALPMLAGAEEIGQVSTVFKFVGPNDRIVVEAFDDPKVEGVTCYLSRAKTGGVKGGLGWPRTVRRRRLPAVRSGRSLQG